MCVEISEILNKKMSPFCFISLITQPPSLLPLVTYLGLAILTRASLSFIRWVYANFLRPPKDLKTTYGSWALVTGATDGIGKAFAHRLARQGLNLILVSRNLEKLRTLSEQIQEESPATQIRTLEVDFSAGRRVSVEEAIRGLDVGVVINNVGITYPGARFFHEVEEKVWMDIVRVNLRGTTEVTRSVVPGMLKRGRGAIVNIGSGASIVVPSHPLYTIYAATKSYVDQLSRCLHAEYKSFGIDAQCQVPLYVVTKMTSNVALIEKPSLFIPTAEEYVRAAVRRIGYEARCTPYWLHSLQWFFSRMLPESLLDAWRLSVGLRRRAMIN